MSDLVFKYITTSNLPILVVASNELAVEDAGHGEGIALSNCP